MRHPKSETSLDHQAKRQAIKLGENNRSRSSVDGVKTISSGSNNTSSSSPMQQQQVPHLNGKMSAPKLSRKKSSTLLQDTTTNVEPVQPEGSFVESQNTLQQQAIPQTNGTALVPLGMPLNRVRHCYHVPLPRFFDAIVMRKFPTRSFRQEFDTHTIGFDFNRTPSTLSMRLSMSNSISGNIRMQLVGLKEPFDPKKSQKHTSLIPAKGQLINGEVLPLGKFNEMQKLAQDNDYIYLKIEALIESGNCNVTSQQSSLKGMIFKETHQVVERIEQLLKLGQFKDLDKLASSMPKDKFLGCLCVAITTHSQLRSIFGYLKEQHAMPAFFTYGNKTVIQEFVGGNKIYDLFNFARDGELETALPLIFRGGHYERFVDLLEMRRKRTEEVDKRPKQAGERTSFEKFLNHFFGRLSIKRDGDAIKNFFTLHKNLEDKHPEIFDSLRGELVWKVDNDRALGSKAKELLDTFIGIPRLLTPTAYCYGFLHVFPENEDNNDSRADDMIHFIENGWAEAIQVALRGKYKLGGKTLWKLMMLARSGATAQGIKGAKPQH